MLFGEMYFVSYIVFLSLLFAIYIKLKRLGFTVFLFLLEGVFSSSGCLGMAALFYCGSPWSFNIPILHEYSSVKSSYFNLSYFRNRTDEIKMSTKY